MGGAESQEAPPYPKAWCEAAPAGQAAHVALQGISEMSIDEFLDVTAPVPELEESAWDLGKFEEHATAAVKADIGLNKMAYVMVPKRATESEFWRLYFCHAYHLVVAAGTEDGGSALTPPEAARATILSVPLLRAADDSTSTAVITAFAHEETFLTFAQKETDAILQRDREDDEKLAVGIKMAVTKGVVPADPPVEPVCVIDVMGMSADAVADAIIEQLGDAPNEGCVLVLQGLSGTGKGTTVAKLQATLPRAVSWSNGNVFRSLTMLAVAHCAECGTPFSVEALTPEMLQKLMSCLKFGKFNGKFDIAISGYGFDVLVSQVANTLLKEPRVGKNIPTLASATQGEVINFAAAAAEAMRADGMNVLMEGRAQTLDYVRTPHRFELTLSDPNIIGMRRAAQRMVGQAIEALFGHDDANPEEVLNALKIELMELSGPDSGGI